MTTFRQHRGRAGEQWACAFLRRAGYQIIATNVRFPVGELDIVARHGHTLCFIEVRLKAAGSLVTPLESITGRKQRRVLSAVRRYLARQRRPWTGPVRFDVVAIRQRPAGPPLIDLIQAAFDADSVKEFTRSPDFCL